MFTMIPSARVIKPIGLLAILFSGLLYLYVLKSSSVPKHLTSALQTHESGIASLDDKGSFIRSFLDTEIDGPWKPKPIQKLCADTHWDEGLTFVCEAPQGGVGNVRNVLLTCLRYAIQAGATNFVLPQIIARDDSDLTKLTTESMRPFTYMFDTQHFNASMYSACPQMTIHDEIPNLDGLAEAVKLSGEALLPDHFAGFVLDKPQDWKREFDKWMSGQTPRPELVSIGTPLLNWPIWFDEAEFVAAFGRMVQFNDQSRRLAGSVLWNMRMKYGLPVKPWEVKHNGYYGAHLRVAEDAVKAGWTGYQEQCDSHLKIATEMGLKTIYVTSESEPAKRFKADGEANGFKITSKDDLLDEGELAELENMAWDQRALVDYQVLLRSQAFGGIDTSSFSWNIAMRRHVVVPGKAKKNRHWTWRNMAAVGWDEGDGLNAQDKISRIMGEKWRFDMFRQAMWP